LRQKLRLNYGRVGSPNRKKGGMGMPEKLDICEGCEMLELVYAYPKQDWSQCRYCRRAVDLTTKRIKDAQAAELAQFREIPDDGAMTESVRG
jgi:hypothetical protein